MAIQYFKTLGVFFVNFLSFWYHRRFSNSLNSKYRFKYKNKTKTKTKKKKQWKCQGEVGTKITRQKYRRNRNIISGRSRVTNCNCQASLSHPHSSRVINTKVEYLCKNPPHPVLLLLLPFFSYSELRYRVEKGSHCDRQEERCEGRGGGGGGGRGRGGSCKI